MKKCRLCPGSVLVFGKICLLYGCILSVLGGSVWLSVTFFGRKSLAAKQISANAYERPTVILDAGHGGFDGGAVAPDGTVEKEINLKIALCLSDMLSSGGFPVVMTREADVSTDDVETKTVLTKKKSDLKNRLALMNDYPNGIFVSIHLNKFTTSSAFGSQVFFGPKNAESARLGDSIQNAIITMLQPYNTRVNKQGTTGTYLLYHAKIPAVLVECGFLSNKTDLSQLKSEEYQKKMAYCCFCGIVDYYTNKGENKNVAQS